MCECVGGGNEEAVKSGGGGGNEEAMKSVSWGEV